MSSFRLPTVVSGITQSVSQFGNAVTGRGGDARYFHTTKKGEIQELKDELHSSNKEKKKEAVKKVIAAMTIGKDVSGLFADVVNCMQTSNVELKKLVYLYVINYAKVQPELAILAVNTFRKDSLDSNPLIRALAVRTMGCIRLEQVIEYLVEPLRRACKDPDPYVRKTAAICICKLHDTSAETVEEQGFIDILNDMLGDGNPTVVANAVASLMEISEATGKPYLVLNESTAGKLLSALNECSEWGQVFILDALATYTPSSQREAVTVLERSTARLSHANAAVVMSTVKVIMRMLDLVDNHEVIRVAQKKVGPPLVTLLSSEPELQYVALRNIALIVQKYPAILSNEVKMFFCKYSDPHYVKMEKLDILIRLTTEKNVEQVLMELREYASEVDIEFVRRAVRAIGRVAIKLERAAERCIAALLSLIETKVNYVVQETVIVMRDIFRKYPDRYESVIGILCENLDTLDEPEAKAAMVWIIGEYAERIDNPEELLSSFLESFHDEPVSVRQQVLTATVKVFLKAPSRSQSLVTRVLKMSTDESDDPDLRDRGYIYWRLLSTNPEATKKVVLSAKPPITSEAFAFDPDYLDSLIKDISSLASVFHKLPEFFVTRLRTRALPSDRIADDDSDEGGEGPAPTAESIAAEMERVEGYQSGESDNGRSRSSSESSASSSSSGPSDLLDLNDEATPANRESKKSSVIPVAVPPVPRVPVLAPTTPGTGGRTGLAMMGSIYRTKGEIFLHLYAKNGSQQTLQSADWAIQINKNSFGLSAASPLQMASVEPGQTAEARVVIKPNLNLSELPPAHPLVLQVAIKCTLDVFYLSPLPFEVSAVFVEREAIDKDTFRTHWQRMGEPKQVSFASVSATTQYTAETLKAKLAADRVALVVMRQQDTFDTLYFSAVTTNNLLLLSEISLQKGGHGVKVTIRADAAQMFPILQAFFLKTLELQIRT